MITIKALDEMASKMKEIKLQGKSIGFVPTMGYLHEGHVSLVERARRENDVLVVSIFVNPTQFGEGEDLDSYPRDIDRDCEICREHGADIVFYPDAVEMYPAGYSTYVNVESDMTSRLCAASRPGHFRGVTTVLTKLFNVIRPDRAYFGQKDAQQVAVVKRMAGDLNMDVEIISCPIVRENDGLAMSSRNTYLSEKERSDALVLSKSLSKAREAVLSGERNPDKVKEMIISEISKTDSANIDYVEVVDADTIGNLEMLKGRVLIALAVKIGKTRLIDNVIMEVK